MPTIKSMRNSHAGRQFQQLPMFMSAREIIRDYQGLDGDRETFITDEGRVLETEEELFDRKFSEAEHTGLVDRLEKQQVRNPISLQADPKKTGSLGKPEILGGHHRIVAMEHLRPDELMPVAHFDSYAQAQKALGENY